jgi:hypothetical protein
MHAPFSASKYSWINYDIDKMEQVFINMQAAKKGDRLHKLAHDMIREGVKAQKIHTTFNMYVNDCIHWRMTPEQLLVYSLNFFGTADAISFDEKKGLLRISDLKTGVTIASVHQLEVYAALFCLEYSFKPFDLKIELRIYQNDDVAVFLADPGVIAHIMDKIVLFDQRIDDMRIGGLA